MPSGKQVLLHLLQKLSLRRQEPAKCDEPSEELRVAFLLHGSTPDHMWHTVERLEWHSEQEPEGEVIRQGLGVRGKAAFLSEIFAAAVSDERIPAAVAERFPGLTLEEYASATELMRLMLTACEWSATYEGIEDEPISPARLAETMQSYRRKLDLFRRHGDAYLTGDYEAEAEPETPERGSPR